MSKYSEILKTLEAAEEGSREIDRAIRSFDPRLSPEIIPYFYSSSLGVAISLVDRIMPEWCNSSIRTGDGEYAAYIWKGEYPNHQQFNCEGAKDRCVAVLTALFRALEKMDGQE